MHLFNRVQKQSKPCSTYRQARTSLFICKKIIKLNMLSENQFVVYAVSYCSESLLALALRVNVNSSLQKQGLSVYGIKPIHADIIEELLIVLL